MIDEKKLNRDDLCDICRSADCANCFSDKDFEKWIDMQPKLNAWIPVSGCADCTHKECEHYGDI